MPAVEEHLTDEETKEICKDLLNTIKIPRNMNLLQHKLPASQYENDKVEEEVEEDNYDDDFEKPEDKKEHTKRDKEQKENKPEIKLEKKISKEKTERIRKKPKGLPPTAPSQRVPPMPQSNRNANVGDLNINPPEVIARNIQSRKGSRGQRVNTDGTRKKRRNPKTTEAQPLESKPNRYQMYRLQSGESQADPMEGKR